MSAAQPDDLDLRFWMADAHSWLGRVAEQQGEFGEAKQRYARQVVLLEELVRREPRWRDGSSNWATHCCFKPIWRWRLANTLRLLG
ncbi:MAG: hypothetical protein IPL39_00315 [Opitutaceae bacterium]|nr:hypothetical protein [Opitutaceae bacterium]